MGVPKFDIDDIVSFENTSEFNPAYKVRTLGKIACIHIYNGEMLYNEGVKDKVCYDLAGYSEVHLDESFFTLVRKANS